MESAVVSLVQLTVSLLIIANPLSAIPIFLGLSEGLTMTERRKACSIAAFSIFCITAISALLGKPILQALDISSPALMVSGGLMVLILGLRMTLGGQTTKAPDDDSQNKNIGAVPLALPILAGPGYITTVIIYSDRLHALLGFWGVFLAASVGIPLALIIFLSLRASATIERIIGSTGTSIATRIMGIFIVAIGVTMVVRAIKLFFHLPS